MKKILLSIFRSIFRRGYLTVEKGITYERLKDIVLITGGSSGLGKEISKKFSLQGATVIVIDLVIPPESKRIQRVQYYSCDVSDKSQILATQKKIKQDFGVVTILINNAAIASGKSLINLSYDEIDKTIQVNLLSSFYTIKTFLPDMIELHRGYIVTIASVLGYMSPAKLSAYGASKSGLISLHESLTYEIGPPSVFPNGVKTLLICPGQLKTTMFRGVKTPSSIFAPELDPEHVANVIFQAINKGKIGEIKLPFYGNFLPIFRSIPWPIVEIARKLSGIDKSMEKFH